MIVLMPAKDRVPYKPSQAYIEGIVNAIGKMPTIYDYMYCTIFDEFPRDERNLNEFPIR